MNRRHSTDLPTEYQSPVWHYTPHRAQSSSHLFAKEYEIQPNFHSTKQEQHIPNFRTQYQIHLIGQPYRSVQRDELKRHYPLVCTYQVPITARSRTCSHGALSIDSPVRSNHTPRSTSLKRHRSPVARYRHRESSSAPWASSAPSIIAVLDKPSPGREAFSPQPACLCCHDGADWEDCRIVIQCFGLGGDSDSVGRVRPCNNTPLAGRTGTRTKRSDSPRPRRKLAYQQWAGDRKCNSLQARSVRLSIVPLNPIYRRRFYDPNCKNCSVRRSLSPRVFSRSSLPVFWCKRVIQRMAFKIDDFTIQEDQVKTAKDVFKRYDKRGQDKISTTDLGPAFRALNLKVKPDTLKEWADQVDDDATGFIDFNGFLICFGKSLQEEQDERDLRDAFRVLDKNKRGEIDVEDLRWILKELGDDLTEEEIDDMIRDTDTDGSGFVDFDEFYKLMTSE
ncbi:Calcium-binding protein [Fasciola hepatica]|uniref:Calcium-binding protein n=1 Tax=Fasciola hepatica TaxID=6192 RepID=A0A4E0S0I4_FASHE|nr:Calcium-binding protein [Fasciola hepatica]